MWGTVEIGSNVYKNTPGLITVGDPPKELAFVERGDDGQLLLTMELYDAEGNHISKLRRNAWVFHDERYSITTNPSDLVLRDETHPFGTPVLQVKVTGPNKITVPRGLFYTPAGLPIEVDPQTLWVGTLALRGNTFEDCANGIHIG
jgi:hypothetical protein